MMPSFVYQLIFLAFNLIQWMIWILAGRFTFPAKRSYVFTVLIQSACAVAAIWLDAYPLADSATLRALSFFALYVVPLLLLYREKPLPILLFSALILGSMVLTEMVISLISPRGELRVAARDYYSLDMIFFYLEYLSCQALAALAAALLYHFLRRKTRGRLSDGERILFLLFPLTQYILLTGWYLNFVDDLSVDELLAALGVLILCVVTDAFLYRLILRISDNARLRARNELMAQQISARNQHYQLLAKNYSDMSRLRHDIANHLYTIQVLLQDGKKAEALEYAEGLRRTDTVKTVSDTCQNTVISSFIRHRSEELAEKNIPLHADIRLPAHCAISDIDMIIAFGNILDNAAEACGETDEPYIRLRAVMTDHCLHIETRNPCPPDSAGPRKRRIPYLERGIGSSILRSLADQYGGTFSIKMDDGVCYTTLVLNETPHDEHCDVR